MRTGRLFVASFNWRQCSRWCCFSTSSSSSPSKSSSWLWYSLWCHVSVDSYVVHWRARGQMTWDTRTILVPPVDRPTTEKVNICHDAENQKWATITWLQYEDFDDDWWPLRVWTHNLTKDENSVATIGRITTQIVFGGISSFLPKQLPLRAF